MDIQIMTNNIDYQHKIMKPNKKYENIYKTLHHSNLHFIKLKKNIKYNIYPISDDMLDKTLFKESPYTHPGIINHIKEHVDYILEFSLSYTSKFSPTNRKISIMFLLDSDTYLLSNSITEMSEYEKRAELYIFKYFYLSTMKAISGTKHRHLRDCGKNLKVYIYDSLERKLLPKNQAEVLSAVNVNSAITTNCSEHGEILVYRKEEQSKVYLHELFHILGLDFSTMDLYFIKNRMRELFHINSDFLIYETYAEFWATILDICINQYIKQTHKLKTIRELKLWKPNKKLYSQTINQIHKNITFSVFQMNKILNFMNITYDIIISNDPSKIRHSLTAYKEDTNVFAYYILKSVFLFNYPKVFEWCSLHCDGIFVFHTNKRALDSFFNLIQSLYEQPEFLDYVREIMKTYTIKLMEARQSKTKISKNSSNMYYLLNNLNMTYNGNI